MSSIPTHEGAARPSTPQHVTPLSLKRSGWRAETHALSVWRSGLSKANADIFDDLTTRVIYIPYEDKPQIMKCTLPESPSETIEQFLPLSLHVCEKCCAPR